MAEIEIEMASVIVEDESIKNMNENQMNPIETDSSNMEDQVFIHDSDFIQNETNVIINMPSGTQKLIQIRKNGKLSIGKFGTFEHCELVGKLFDLSYDIENGKVIPSTKNIFDHVTYESNLEACNQHLNDNPASQKLSNNEILTLKNESLSGTLSSQDVIKTIVDNSSTFNQKTDFAKAKYIKRKEKKFSKSFVALKPTVRTLCDFYFVNEPSKVLDMRIDTLSQLVAFSNVHPGCKMIVLDDTNGLVLGSLLSRMNSTGLVLAIHNKQTERYGRIQQQSDEVDEPIFIETDTNDFIQRRKQTIKKSIDLFNETRSHLILNSFDGLIMAIDNHPLIPLKKLLPFLAPSRPIVIYSPFKELLLDTYLYLRTSREFVNVQLTESWMREYQVPLHLVGTHPHMSTSGSGGFLLTATKICDDGSVEYDPTHFKKQRK